MLYKRLYLLYNLTFCPTTTVMYCIFYRSLKVLKAKNFHVATGHLLCALGEEPAAKDVFDMVFAPGFKEKKPSVIDDTAAAMATAAKPDIEPGSSATDSATAPVQVGDDKTKFVPTKLPGIDAIEEENEDDTRSRSKSKSRGGTSSGAAPAPLPKLARPNDTEKSSNQKKNSPPDKSNSKPTPPSKEKSGMFNIGNLLGIGDKPEEIKPPEKKYFLSVQTHGMSMYYVLHDCYFFLKK